MGLITNHALDDIVELDGQHYIVRSGFAMMFERGYTTFVRRCDNNGNYPTSLICAVQHECTFEAVEKGHKEIISDLARYIADYKAKQEEERKKREEEQKQARSTINKMFDTFHGTFATSYNHTYSDEQVSTFSDLINAIIRG